MTNMVGHAIAETVGTADFATFYARHHASTLAVVLALRGSDVPAEEIVQEAFLVAYRRWDDVAGMDRPDLWVHRVALNAATSRLRRLAAETRALTRLAGRRDAEATGVPPLADDDVRFWATVRRLPRAQREAVALHYAADLPVADVATVLGCPEGTVKSRLHAARERYAALIAEER
ncbi:MAG: sigma-70 family RNA polymerase sigma factor [Actinobacteria bacterium]|nr:sigma-70 family RNA polymerase sigma factor [Actinomycetota bacterium]